MELIEIEFKKKHKNGPAKGTKVLVKESTAINWMKSGHATPTDNTIRKRLKTKINGTSKG